MADIDRRGTDITKSAHPGTQAEIDVFEIAAVIPLRQESHRIEAGPCDIQAKSDAVGNVHDDTRIDLSRNPVDSRDSASVAAGVGAVRNRKACKLAVIGKWRNGADIG